MARQVKFSTEQAEVEEIEIADGTFSTGALPDPEQMAMHIKKHRNLHIDPDNGIATMSTAACFTDSCSFSATPHCGSTRGLQSWCPIDAGRSDEDESGSEATREADPVKIMCVPSLEPGSGLGAAIFNDMATPQLDEFEEDIGPAVAVGEISVGSANHGAGECRPCAWYWKPGGCQNGKACMHCHLCSEDELKLRKKAKLDRLRPSFRRGPSTWKQQGVNNRGSDSRQQSKNSTQQALIRVGSCTPPPPPLGLVQPDIPPPPLAFDQGELPSAGSALHALGKCKPCAWFWKPQGCKNGKECCHCHSCPRGEHSERRRVKDTAMQNGYLLPAKKNGLSRTSPSGKPVLKISNAL